MIGLANPGSGFILDLAGPRLQFVTPAIVSTGAPAVAGLQLAIMADKTYSDAGFTACVDGDPIYQATDQSGNSLNAVEATLSHRPTYIASAQNGLPVMRFNGTLSELFTPSFQAFPGKRGTIFVAAKFANFGAISQTILCPTTGSVGWQYATENAVIEYYDGSSFKALEASAPADGWHVVTIMRDSDTTLKEWRDGVAGNTVTIANTQPSPSIIGIGSAGSERWHSDIGEIQIYDGVLSDSDRVAVETYLRTRWGTP